MLQGVILPSYDGENTPAMRRAVYCLRPVSSDAGSVDHSTTLKGPVRGGRDAGPSGVRLSARFNTRPGGICHCSDPACGDRMAR